MSLIRPGRQSAGGPVGRPSSPAPAPDVELLNLIVAQRLEAPNRPDPFDWSTDEPLAAFAQRLAIALGLTAILVGVFALPARAQGLNPIRAQGSAANARSAALSRARFSLNAASYAKLLSSRVPPRTDKRPVQAAGAPEPMQKAPAAPVRPDEPAIVRPR